MTGQQTLGWYLHHHGTGHLIRFLAIRPHLRCDVVVFSSLPTPQTLPDRTRWMQLPRDDQSVGEFVEPEAGGLLHWAPLHNGGYRDRMMKIAAAVGTFNCAAFVIDVSVEVTLLIRILGIPAIVFTQPGERMDLPHQLAYRAAQRIVAPWPAPAQPSRWLQPWSDKLTFVGGISRFAERARQSDPVPGRVLFIGGGGGSCVTSENLRSAADATPERTWSYLGAADISTVDNAGSADGGQSAPQPRWVDDPWPLLCAASTVVSFAGQNAVADLAAAGVRAIVVPQHRPFDEQTATAHRLSEMGLAVTLPQWPRAERAALSWQRAFEAVDALTPDWASWGIRGATERAAAAITEVMR